MVELNRRNMQRFIRTKNTGDVVVRSETGDNTLDFEDKVVYGDWVDEEGNTGKKSKFSVMYAGVANTLQGQIGGIMGAKDEQRTARGMRAANKRQERRYDYFDY